MQNANSVKHVYIVDDHPLIRRGLRHLFEQEPNLTISGEANSIEQALVEMRRQPADVVIVDISLPEGNGLDLIKRLHALSPGLPVVVCSMHDERFFAGRALNAGARGYVSKLDAPEYLVAAVKAALAGRIYIRKELAADEVQNYLSDDVGSQFRSPVEALTNRELEVFEQIGSGYGTAQIAEHLNLSVKTIETHRLHIKQKLKLTTSAELSHHALHWVMLDTNLSGRAEAQ
jgi:DNA-binding NarL/FixJ family response regulator